jgi:hypothetical protein
MASLLKNLLGLGASTDGPPVPRMPKPPQPDLRATEKAVGLARRRGTGAQRPGTLLTGPAGLDAPAPRERTTLLGG